MASERRRRPWQVVRKLSATQVPATTRSYAEEQEALDAAIEWCREQAPGDQPVAYVHDKDDESMLSDDVLSSPSHQAQYSKDGSVLMVASWPPSTRREADAFANWAMDSRLNGEKAGPAPKGGPTWRDVEVRRPDLKIVGTGT